MDKSKCTFCEKLLSSEYNLNRHLLICKKKVVIEKKTRLDKIKESKNYKCSYCNHLFTTNTNLTRHLLTFCKKKESHENNIQSELKLKEEKIKELEEIRLKDEKIKELNQDKIKELEEKLKQRETLPQKISNKTINKNQHIDTQNITNNITIYQVMTPQHVLEVFQKHYKLDTLLGGQKALARFINEEFLKEHATPVYVCGDRSRQKFYMIKDGKKEEDPDCENIIGLSSPGLPHVRDVYEEALFTEQDTITEEDIQDNYRNITNLDKDRTQFKSELSKITTTSDEPKEQSVWQKAVEQLKSMRQHLVPYEKDE